MLGRVAIRHSFRFERRCDVELLQWAKKRGDQEIIERLTNAGAVG